VDSAPSFVVQIPDLSSSERRIGFTSEPVPPLIRSGASVSRNVCRLSFRSLAANVFKMHWSASGMPMATMART